MDPTDRTSTPTRPIRGSHILLRLGRFVYRLFVLAMSSVLVSGVGHAVASPIESGGTVEDITSLIRERNHTPAGFEAEVGYAPVSSDGLLLDPDGGCSTPGRIGPSSFDTACKAHDFGYDVLRFSAATGRPARPSARYEADRLLYQDIVDTCTTPRCEATAALYFAAVSANSLRQGYGPPSPEPVTPWALVVAGVILVAWLDPSSIGRVLRRLRPTRSDRRRHRLRNVTLSQAVSPRVDSHLTGTTRGRPPGPPSRLFSRTGQVLASRSATTVALLAVGGCTWADPCPDRRMRVDESRHEDGSVTLSSRRNVASNDGSIAYRLQM